MTFDFKKFHIRGMNAANEAEKAAINQELKDLYDSLDENQKVQFNQELQEFLLKEYATISSVYEGVKSSNNPN